MQQIDLIDAFTLLKEYGIVVVRAGYVDSAENALVFANRRPIVLYALHPDRHGYDSAHGERGADDEAIRAAYKRLSAKSGSKLFAHEEIEPGTDITLVGDITKDGKSLRFISGSHKVERLCPLAEDAAESMLDEFRSHRALGSNEKAVRTLAHLFVKTAKMYYDSGIDTFTLRVRVHDNGYKVIDATMMTERMPEILRRLGRHAHDRWSYDYHPAERPSLEPHIRDNRNVPRR